MASVEDRIVAMKFDNKQFEPAAKTSMSTLDRLKAALNFGGAGKGLTDLQNTANKFSLGNLAAGASGVASKFSAMSVVAIAAIASITAKAVDAGIRIAKAFTIAPLKQGFQEYETNLNAVQTILANTQASGVKLKDVNATLQELNTYSDKTIYNFSEMAKNIGTFTAAGVDLKTSAMSIKGIANLAALSGSNSQQASSAMYQLSQAISSGRVSLQDWNSVVNAGMGGTVFQRALAQTAEKMGTLDKGAVKLTGKMKNVSIAGKSFRESITAKPGEESWLTSKVLTETLKQFTGDMTDAQLASMGFNKAQIKSIQEQAKTAQNAATQVKTFTQLIGTLQESAGSGWAQTFQILLGDFEEAKKLWTNINDVIGGFIANSAKARNKTLQEWKDLGGRTALLNGIQNVFNAIVQVVKPIRDAFREIFPATTGKQLFAMTTAFLNFTKTLKIGADTSRNLKRTFAGLFAIFSIGWQAVKAIFNVLGDLFGLLGSHSGGFLELTGDLGDFLVNLDKTIKKGDLFNKFFKKLGDILQIPLNLLKAARLAIKGLFVGFDQGVSEGIANALGRIKDRLAPLANLGGMLGRVWAALSPIFKRVGEALAPLGKAIGEALRGIGDAIGKAFKAGDFNSVYDALNTGLLAGIVLLINKFIKTGLKIDLGGGFASSIRETFGALTDTLSAMQSQIQAKTLLLIAGAIAILTASIVALSLIDSKKLSKSLLALGVAFGQLLVAMSILTKVAGAAGFVKVPVIAASMILLAGAVVVLTAAVAILSRLNWDDLAKGLVGVGALLAMIVATSAGLSKSSGAMLRTGLAMIPLAIGIKILGTAVKDFAEMSWADLGKGMAALAAALLIIAGAVALMPPTLAFQAAGLLILSVALLAIGTALQNMGGMKWSEIAKAMVVLAGSLILLAAAMIAMTEGLPGAAALLVAAAALVVLVPALKGFASLSWEEIGKAMVVLAGSLILLAGGLILMTASLPGAAALTVAAAALAVLAPVLIVLGAMSWESICKGLVALAGAFVVLGLSTVILLPLIPAILALSAALLILGAAVTLIGVGILALASGFAIFVAAGSAGIAVLTGMINLIPLFLTKFAEGIIGFATTIANQAGKFTKAFTSLLISLIDAVIAITPKLAKMLNVMIDSGLRVLVSNAPKFANAGLKILLAFLTAISKNINKITRVVADLIVRFLNALQSQQGRVLNAGARFIISFINKLASTIRGNQAAMNAAGRNLGSAILSGLTGGLSDGAWRVASMAAGVARRALAAAKSALGISSPSKEFYKIGGWSTEGMADGFRKTSGVVESAAAKVGTSAVSAIKKSMEGIGESVASQIDIDPTITPVLDLTKLTEDASKISGLIGKMPIAADVSFGQASDIAQNRQNGSLDSSNAVGDNVTIFEYKQEINSPKPLSLIDIYRDTKSLLSMKKEALSIP